MQKLLDRNFLTALVLFGVSWMFSVGSSSDPKDWAFPLLANYVTLGVAVILLVHFFVSVVRQQVPDQLQFSPDDRASAIDVLVFLTFVLAFMFVMYGFGFWLSSLIMLIMIRLSHHPKYPIRYTVLKTKIQMASTKCQYQVNTSTASC